MTRDHGDIGPAVIAAVIVALVLLSGCGVPLESWNTQHPVMCPKGRCCPPLAHVRGPDAYDRAHHEPFHCEAGPVQDDILSRDVDATEDVP